MLVFFMLPIKKLIKKYQSVSHAGKNSGKKILLFLEQLVLPQNVDPVVLVATVKICFTIIPAFFAFYLFLDEDF